MRMTPNDPGNRRAALPLAKWIMAWDGQDPRPVPNHHVLTLPQHGKPRLFKRADSIKVIDAGKLGQN
jgi:hypothetical protein